MAAPFEVIFHQDLTSLLGFTPLTPIANKRVLSLTNDYEDTQWRYVKFQDYIWDNISEAALSIRDRKALISRPSTILTECAKKLRLSDKSTDKGKGSEIAEIILYGIMKDYYGALSVVPKIFYKQNSQDFAKGSDSIHIVIEEPLKFSLWFGESKFYDNIEDFRLDAVVKSVQDSLQSEKLKKENSIITNVSDLDELGLQDDLLKSIKDTLASGTSTDKIKPILNIPILLLHESEIIDRHTDVGSSIRQELLAFQKDRAEKYFKKQIDKCSTHIAKYDEVKFHLIFFPVPSKNRIVETFVKKAETFRAK